MNCATRNKTRFPRPNIPHLSFHGERHYALNSVDGLVVLLVIMGQRHLRSDWDREFKHRHGTTRVGSLEQESDSYLPDADNFVFHGDSGLTILPTRVVQLNVSSATRRTGRTNCNRSAMAG